MFFDVGEELNSYKAKFVWVGKTPIDLSILSIAPMLEEGIKLSSWKDFMATLRQFKPPVIAFGRPEGIRDLQPLCLPIPGLAICVIGKNNILDDLEKPGVDMLFSFPIEERIIKTFRILRKRVEYEAHSINQTNSKNSALEGLAHDLRTPTTTIMAYTELLKDDVPDGFKDDLDHIQKNASIVEDLASRIIALTNEGSSAIGVHPKQIKTEDLMDRSLEALLGAAKAKNININFNVSPDFPALWIDPAAGERIIINILDNGISAAPEGSSITVDSELSGDFIRFQISDEGPGISPELLSKIFIRSQNSVDTHGLGMAIAWELVTLHEGVIWAENRPDKGAVFTLTLPTVKHKFMLFKSVLGEITANPIPHGINISFKGIIGKETVGTIRSNILATIQDAQCITLDFNLCCELASGILALLVELSLESDKRSCVLKIKNVPPALQPFLKEINLFEYNDKVGA